ncbi:hypothetical protein U5U50_01445 [Mycoplasma sp. 888]|uniref:hypothetical protein n=1 Tax=Mycoplasma sp. 888 TaxID=3108483 RepID=UPI002D7862E9|nr:hypothetical protein [Mycoplasma sp. 888]WRQ26046.1 hypothetical protein U5U50_01445 [Mycoplasma sp. 888]
MKNNLLNARMLFSSVTNVMNLTLVNVSTNVNISGENWTKLNQIDMKAVERLNNKVLKKSGLMKVYDKRNGWYIKILPNNNKIHNLG